MNTASALGVTYEFVQSELELFRRKHEFRERHSSAVAEFVSGVNELVAGIHATIVFEREVSWARSATTERLEGDLQRTVLAASLEWT